MASNFYDMISSKGENISFSTVNTTLTATNAFSGTSPESFQTFFSETRKLPSIEEVELNPPQDVCPPDERVRILETKEFPWRTICRLEITRADGLVAVGTGWFIGNGTVITAGHCVFSKEMEKWHKSIIIIPGKDNETEPFGRFESTNFWTVTGWKEHGSQEYDYGAIILENKIGEKLGYFGFRADPDSILQNKIIVNSGYPADKDDNLIDTQWKMNGSIEQPLTERKIAYKIDTYGGNSGGPLWIDDGLNQAVGIHAYGGCPNSGSRINKEVFANLIEWKRIGDSNN